MAGKCCGWWKSASGLVIVGVVVGVFFTSGFTTVLDYTNTTEFCVSCHEMQTNKDELTASVHGSTRSGAHAQCADCHVPQEFGPKMLRKINAANDVYHHLLGTLDTPQKYTDKRQELAERVWDYMEKSDSRECRTCHSFETMKLEKQASLAKQKHPQARQDGKTCISCHKGVAHKLPPRDD